MGIVLCNQLPIKVHISIYVISKIQFYLPIIVPIYYIIQLVSF